jgi:lipopolysaccharide transport system ATP-binding protein
MSGYPATFTFHLSHPVSKPSCVFTVYDALGLPVTNFSSDRHAPEDSIGTGVVEISCHVPVLYLVPGSYRINVAISSSSELQDHVEGAASFSVDAGIVAGRSVRFGGSYGSSVMPHVWRAPSKPELDAEVRVL